MKIALFLPDLRGGGAERLCVDLASTFSRCGHVTHLVPMKHEGPYLRLVPEDVRLIRLNFKGSRTCTIALARYLRAEKPDGLISALPEANGIAALAWLLSGRIGRIVLTEHNTQSITFNNIDGLDWKTRILYSLYRNFYRFSDALIGVSENVAGLLRQVPGVRAERVHTIYNGVDVAGIAAKSAGPLVDPWFSDRSTPVILGVGRLQPQKDFETLIKAFNVVRKKKSARLVIFGEGEERQTLQSLVTQLDLDDFVRLPGFVLDPFTFMATAHVFALSSLYEGFSLAIVEALACGTPVVSTDCPSGPSEILKGGRYGRLVPVGGAEAMAAAILATLDDPPPRDMLLARAQEFSIDRCADAYLRLLSAPIH